MGRMTLNLNRQTHFPCCVRQVTVARIHAMRTLRVGMTFLGSKTRGGFLQPETIRLEKNRAKWVGSRFQQSEENRFGRVWEFLWKTGVSPTRFSVQISAIAKIMQNLFYFA